MPDTKDRPRKRSILAELKNEVKDFHPLLDRILGKLPRVSNIEYTHGPHEKGADFVISRIDDTIGDVEYIGALVKTGSINTSLTNIYDQIDDCDSQRIILKGRKAINLSEIWIITNETISNRAQEKIFERFRSRKIKFLDRDVLIKWVDEFLPSFWSKIPSSIAQYLQDIQMNMSELDSSFSLLPANIKPFYLDTPIRKIDHDYKSRKSEKPEDIFDVLDCEDFLILESGPGGGKSQLVRNTIKFLSSPEGYLKNKSLPIFTTFQIFSENYSCDLSSLLSGAESQIGDIEEFKKCKFIIFIDGFDEKLETERDLTDELEKIIEDASKIDNLKLVLTTRPLAIVDYRKILPGCSPGYQIVPFGSDKILRFLKEICREVNISTRLFEDIKNNGLFKQLPRNPISAILLANLINDNSRDLPANLTDIYRKYTELMLGRWDIDKGLQSDKEYEAGKEILTHLAKYFIDNSLTTISSKEAIGQFKSYLKERNLDIDPEMLFRKISHRSGILQENQSNKTVYFKHRSFAEYFYALYKQRHQDDKFLDSRLFNPFWKNIYFFYVGVLKDCEEVLEEILLVNPESDDNRFFRTLVMADYFLAAYTTPYRIVEKNLPKLIVEYQEFYFDVISNKIDTPLNDMPEITILEFFQAVLNNAYSYDFFLKALDNAILEISADPKKNDKEKAYSLFFVSVIYRALDRPNPFDGLIDELKGKLPLPLQFGLYYEANRTEKPSKALKRIERNLKNKLKKQKDIHAITKKLHEKPVRFIKDRENS
jgi:NACHT C-terminal Helical domain 1